MSLLKFSTIVAKQSHTIVYQCDLDETINDIIMNGVCPANVTMIRQCVLHVELIKDLIKRLPERIGRARKIAAKCVPLPQDPHIARDTLSKLEQELKVMEYLTKKGAISGDAAANGIPLPLSLVTVTVPRNELPKGLVTEDRSDTIELGVVLEEYCKAAPLHRLFYAFPNGIHTLGPDKQIKYDLCRDVLFQICRLLRFLHVGEKKGPDVFYNDLKLPNVLLDTSGLVHLVDFGSSIIVDSDNKSPMTSCTLHLSAPELHDAKNHNKITDIGHPGLGIAPDLWALGVIAFEWVFARRLDVLVKKSFGEAEPWWKAEGAFHNGRLMDSVFEAPWRPDCQHKLQAASLIQQLTSLDPAARVLGRTSSVAAAWSSVLEHPFLADITKGHMTEDIEDEIDMQTLGM